jgi:phage terminase small subunit
MKESSEAPSKDDFLIKDELQPKVADVATKDKRKYTKKHATYEKWGGSRKGSGRKRASYDPQALGDSKPDKKRLSQSLYGLSDSAEAKIAEKSIQRTEDYIKSDYTLPCPEDLKSDSDAKKQWNLLMESYASYGSKIICNLDISLLRLFCESKSRYVKAYSTWQNMLKSEIVNDDQGIQYWIDKCLKIMEKETDIMRGLSSDLLLSPNGRVKANITKNVGGKSKEEEALESIKQWQES